MLILIAGNLFKNIKERKTIVKQFYYEIIPIKILSIKY